MPVDELSNRVAVLPDGLPSEPRGSPGTFEVAGDSLFFTPRFPFVPGATYVLVVNGQRWPIERARPTMSRTTEVEEIYPTARQLPLNQLKLYLAFSAPMSEGWAERAVTVRRASTEEPLQSVFLPMESELWDPRRRRLTMLLDPGRIKRGLAPHEEAGYPLQEGDAVVVSVEGEWKDARGVALRGGAERLYEIGPAVRERIDPATWTVAAPPRAGSNAPLAVRFDRPLDRALLEHCLRVRDVPGAQTIGTEERSWGFVPDTPWRPGSHALAIDTRLEDLGGNSLGRVFDRDLSSSEDDPVPTGTSWVRFDIPARR